MLHEIFPYFLYVKMSEDVIDLQISFYCTIFYGLTFVSNIMKSYCRKISFCGNDTTEANEQVVERSMVILRGA